MTACTKQRILVAGVAALVFGMASLVSAHFQRVIPSRDIVSAEDEKTIALDVVFGHPMEGPTMDMGKPKQFGVLVGGRKKDLLDTLKPKRAKGSSAYETRYKIRQPGDHVFYLEPAPYWEPAEGCMIVHYTKVIVNAMGLEQGWDETVGFEAEIVPRTRPYGLWTGNLFSGVVLRNGKAVPFAEIEVEHLGDGKVEIPSDPFITQVLKADETGAFHYAMPRAGWWGFAALLEGENPMKNPEGKKVDVEIGALIWVHVVDMK